MVDDRPEDTGSLPDSDRPKREPPTIDLKATEVSSETQHAAADVPPEPAPEAASPPPDDQPIAAPVAAPVSTPVSPWIVAPISGAVAAALVIGVGWMLGWPAVQPPPSAAPQLNAAVIDELTARVAGLESKAGKPVADPAAAARAETLEKSLAALRGELATTRAQGEKLAAAVSGVKAAPPGVAPPDLSAINERIAKIEGAMRAQSAEIAQQGSKIADAKDSKEGKPADDVPLRRVVATVLLDVLVRTGDSYPTALTAAKALAPDPDVLKPLDEFAAKGVPNAAKLSSEFLALVPKLSPAAPDNATTGVVERLQAGAAKLVRIERTDTVGNDRGAVVARATAAALRNDFNEARRELKLLAPADRVAAQSWLDRADARDAALAASRQFAADAMAAFAKPAQ
jgi:hypothetical protein